MRMRILTLALLGTLPLVACSDQDTVTSPLAEGLAPSFSLSSGDCADQTQIPRLECEALVALYNTTNGIGWTNKENWGNDEPCGWDGIMCEDVGPVPWSVVWIDLTKNNLSGPIPAELGNLTGLVHLQLGENHLSGPIPAELGNLGNLESLWAHQNQLSGAIPAELGQLSKLIVLALYSNQLTGEIPAELGNLAKLEALGIMHNQLEGEIPASLGNLSNLESLWAHQNQLSGAIPAELGNLTELTGLGLSRNQLSGPIPASLGNLTALVHLELHENQLSGPIPAELGNLGNLEELWAYQNQLSGRIPAGLGNLSQLKALVLQENQLTGPIPAKLGDLSHLGYLDLRSNQLSGLVPIEVAALSASEPLASGDCWFRPGNNGLYVPDIDSYRDHADGDGQICRLGLTRLIQVTIDIKPGSFPNSINTKSMGKVPVAIMGTEDFDVMTVDPYTVLFGPDGAAAVIDPNDPGFLAVGDGHIEDVNGDGFWDLVLQFVQKETGLKPGDTVACITGLSDGDLAIEGCDAVRTM